MEVVPLLYVMSVTPNGVVMLLLHPVLMHLEIVSLYCIIVCVTEGQVLFVASLNVSV